MLNLHGNEMNQLVLELWYIRGKDLVYVDKKTDTGK